MEQHPIPRQITTFEFKLIGFMTLRQFLYLVVFAPIGYIVFRLFPIPFLNFIFGLAIAGLGAAFAFVPIQDRPLEVWLKNFFKRLRSPTQYTYHKNNPPLSFLQDLYFQNDPHQVMAHIESQRKLAAYLEKKTLPDKNRLKKEHIQNILRQPTSSQSSKTTKRLAENIATSKVNSYYIPATPNISPNSTDKALPSEKTPTLKKPFLTGIIRNNRQIPLPGILVYIKDLQNNTLRLLKTNPHGVFATYNPLPKGEYIFEMKDPNATYFFDTMKIKIEGESLTNLNFYSKELL